MPKLLLVLLAGTLFAEADKSVVRNVVVYQESGRFGGWPANNGVWIWGSEIVVGFMQGYFKNKERGHAIDGDKPEVPRFARSLDGGETWKVEVPSFLNDEGKEAEPMECPGNLDFSNPNSAVTFRMVSSQRGFSRFYYSSNRAKAWLGPYKLPTFDRKGIAARTDYLVDGRSELIAFITASKENGREGRVLCIRTKDGGKSWNLVSWIGPEPEGFAIMPSSVRLSPSQILTTTRRKEGEQHFIDAWSTGDNGANWTLLGRAVESTGGSVGNPPSMIKLKDGRLALTYGFRSAPFGIRARLSGDGGKSWGNEIILRDDAGTWDLGYPRTVQRADGKIVTIYYFNDGKDKERYIAATIWDPALVK